MVHLLSSEHMILWLLHTILFLLHTVLFLMTLVVLHSLPVIPLSTTSVVVGLSCIIRITSTVGFARLITSSGGGNVHPHSVPHNIILYSFISYRVENSIRSCPAWPLVSLLYGLSSFLSIHKLVYCHSSCHSH